jgi:putative hydrolase of the HAD superfamily
VVKAVFFDWFNTLARYEPPRENLESQALHESGIDISPSKIIPGLLLADRYYYEENAISPMRARSPEEQAKVYVHYQQMILTEAGVKVSPEAKLLLQTMNRMRLLAQGMRFVLFPDVLTTLKAIKERRLIMGLLTNLDRDITPICRELGLEPYLNFVVTSADVGADKPAPPIFLAALERARVEAKEAVHVGDQYKSDVVGARGVGINAILLDRFNVNHEITDCPCIQNLSELSQYLV